MTQIVLSPIALTVRDQTTHAVEPRDTAKVQTVCSEVLENNTTEIALGSPEMKAIVASVVQGALAALALSRAGVIERVMHAIARFASTREGSDPTVVAAVICDAASVIEVSEGERQTYLESMIESVLAACDHMLGPERDELAEFLRTTLPKFLEGRAGVTEDAPTQPEQNAS